MHYFGRCSSALAELVPLPHSRGKSTHYSNWLHDFSVTIPGYNINSFFPCRARNWKSLAAECFPLTYDLNDFKSRINGHLFSFSSS